MSDLKFPRFRAELFLVTLNIAWDNIVPSEEHICPEDEDDLEFHKIRKSQC